MIKNAFCFMLKALLVLKIYNLLSLLFVHVGRRRLDKKAKVNIKLMTTQTVKQIITIQILPKQIIAVHILLKQIIAIHILPNISRSKGNQTIKIGQLIEYNVRNVFLEKIIHKMR